MKEKQRDVAAQKHSDRLANESSVAAAWDTAMGNENSGGDQVTSSSESASFGRCS